MKHIIHITFTNCEQLKPHQHTLLIQNLKFQAARCAFSARKKHPKLWRGHFTLWWARDAIFRPAQHQPPWCCICYTRAASKPVRFSSEPRRDRKSKHRTPWKFLIKACEVFTSLQRTAKTPENAKLGYCRLPVRKLHTACRVKVSSHPINNRCDVCNVSSCANHEQKQMLPFEWELMMPTS